MGYIMSTIMNNKRYIALGVVYYFVLRKYGRAVEPSTRSKSARVGGSDAEVKRPSAARLEATRELKNADLPPYAPALRDWAALSLALNIAVFSLPAIFWPHPAPDHNGFFVRRVHITIGLPLIFDAISAFIRAIFIGISFFWESFAETEARHASMRSVMIGVAAKSALFVMWAFELYPQHLSASEKPLMHYGAIAYTLLHGVVWMYFVFRSQRYSEANAAAHYSGRRSELKEVLCLK